MTSVEKKKAELELYEFIYDQLENKDHIFFSDLQTQLEYTRPSIFKYFQCEHCIKSAISKFPDCFYISKLKDTVLLTSTANVRKDYYKHYMNCARIGSVVTEVFTICTSLIAKLELYNYLVQSLKTYRIVLLETVLTTVPTISEHCQHHFKCKHAILEAIEEFSQVFTINPVFSTVNLDDSVKWITTECVLDSEKDSLGTIFNTDTLLYVAVKTYVQLVAELQLYEISKENTVPPESIQISELAGIVLQRSKPCREYMSSCAKIKTVLSLFPDIFYISKRNRVLQRHSVNMPAEDWYNCCRLNIALFDNLLFNLKEILSKELAKFKVAEITRAQLKENKHVSMHNLINSTRQNGYCRKYFNQMDALKLAVLSFSGLFHISKRNNVLLLENEWESSSIRQSHDTISGSVLYIAMRSCRRILAESHMYCFLVDKCCNAAEDNHSISLEVLLTALTSNSPVCRQVFTSLQLLEESVTKYSSQFNLDKGYFISTESEIPLSTGSAAFPSTVANIQSSGNTLVPNEEETMSVGHPRTSCKNKTFLQTLEPDPKEHSESVAKSTSDQANSNIHVSAFNNNISNEHMLPSTFECVHWGTAKTVTNAGTMNSLFKTEGFVLLHHSDIIVPTIVDVVYVNGVQVTNLFDIDEKVVCCTAIGEEGSTQLNWKAALVWIGAKPNHVSCAVKSKLVWENIKSLYEKRFENNNSFIPASVSLDSCEIVKLDAVDLSPSKDKVQSSDREVENFITSLRCTNSVKGIIENVPPESKLRNSFQSKTSHENINSSLTVQCDSNFFIEPVIRGLRYDISTDSQTEPSPDTDSTNNHSSIENLETTIPFHHVTQSSVLMAEEKYFNYGSNASSFCYSDDSYPNLNSKQGKDQVDKSINSVDNSSKNKTLENEVTVINKNIYGSTVWTTSQPQNVTVEIYSDEEDEVQNSTVTVDLISNDSNELKHICCSIL